MNCATVFNFQTPKDASKKHVQGICPKFALIYLSYAENVPLQKPDVRMHGSGITLETPYWQSTDGC